MIRHIVSWNFDKSLPEEENKNLAIRMKEDLEKLKDTLDGIIEFKVNIDLLSTSNVDILIDSLFESEEALQAYQVHPDHKAVGAYASPLLKNRKCGDYIE